jgi:hypothetical protein
MSWSVSGLLALVANFAIRYILHHATHNAAYHSVASVCKLHYRTMALKIKIKQQQHTKRTGLKSRMLAHLGVRVCALCVCVCVCVCV